MKRSALLGWIFGCAAVGISSGARAQDSRPSYVNLYWETSTPPPGFPRLLGADWWDSDISISAAGNTDLASMTRDNIDSYYQSMLSVESGFVVANSFFVGVGWASWLSQYGVNVLPVSIDSFSIVPDQLALSQDAALQQACSGVTPSTDQLAAWNRNIPSFIACAAAAHGSALPATGGPPYSISESASNNVVVNVFLPPWLQGASNDSNWAGTNGLPCAPTLCGAEYCLPVFCGIPGCVQPAGAYNWELDGYEATVHPTQGACMGTPAGMSSLLGGMSHELIEATTEQQIADPCEEGPQLPFLANGWDLVSYMENGPPFACFPNPANDVPPMQSPSVEACGSGQNVQVLAVLDQTGGRNFPPWDLPSNPIPSFEAEYAFLPAFVGSLYFAVNVPSVPPEAEPFTAGGEHVSIINSVTTNLTNWDQTGFVLMNGFGGAFPLGAIPPTTQLNVRAFDTIWGQENVQLGGDPAAYAELPDSFAIPPVPSNGYGTYTIPGQLLGSPNCGADIGHQVSSPVPEGSATVKASGDCSGSTTTDANGNFNFAFTPQNGPQVYSCTFTAQDNMNVTGSVQIPIGPEATTVSPSVGPVAGGQTVTISGQGLVGFFDVTFAYYLSDGSMSAALGFDPANPLGPALQFPPHSSNPQGTSISVLTPPSPIPGTGVVLVFVCTHTGNVACAEPLTYTYVEPGVPFLTFAPVSQCLTDVQQEVTATIYDAQGNLQPTGPTLQSIQITLAPGPSEPGMGFGFPAASASPQPGTPVTISNGGTALGRYDFLSDSPFSFSVSYQSFPPLDCRNVLGKKECSYALSGSTTATFPPLPQSPRPCWGVRHAYVGSAGGHVHEEHYSRVGSSWRTPVAGDSWDWSEPTVLGITTPNPQTLSSLEVTSLGIGDIQALGSFVPSGNAIVALPFTPPPGLPDGGSSLCLTGRAVQIGDVDGGEPGWNALVSFPVEQSIPAADFRVFGLSTASGFLVEMPVTTVQTPSGPTVQAQVSTTDPNGVVSGTVDGPDVLAYWSGSTCPGAVPVPAPVSPCGFNTSACPAPNSTMFCAQIRTDPANCGACGVTCSPGQVCTAGTCVAPPNCPEGRVACGSPPACVDLLTDDSFCSNSGQCGSPCPSGQGCAGGQCVADVPVTGGEPVYCQGNYLPPVVVPANGVVASTAVVAAQASANNAAICSCAAATLSQQVTTDSFNSLTGPYVDGGTAGAVLVNGALSDSQLVSVEGNLSTEGSASLTDTGNFVAGNLLVEGALTVGSLSVGGNATIFDTITGNLTVAGTLDAGAALPHTPVFDATSGDSVCVRGNGPVSATVTMVAGETGFVAFSSNYASPGGEGVTGGGNWTMIGQAGPGEATTYTSLWTNGAGGGVSASSITVTHDVGVFIACVGQFTNVGSVLTANAVTTTTTSQGAPGITLTTTTPYSLVLSAFGDGFFQTFSADLGALDVNSASFGLFDGAALVGNPGPATPGAVTSEVTIGGLAGAPWSAVAVELTPDPPAPCNCGNPIDIAGIVANGASNNDNASIGLNADALVNPQTGLHLDLPCGAYYLTGMRGSAPTTPTAQNISISVHGNTVLYVGDNIDTTGLFEITVDPTAQLSLFVGGFIQTSQPAEIGSTEVPMQMNVYVADPPGGVNAGGSLLVAGNLYVPAGPLTTSGPLTVYGSVLANGVNGNGPITVHYDRGQQGLCPQQSPCTPSGNVCDQGAISCDGGVATCVDTGVAAPNGTACALNQVCDEGACTACTEAVSCTPANPCDVGTTDCSSGSPVCDDTGTPVANGTGCGTNQVCDNGSCAACTAGAGCTPANACHAGTTSCSTGMLSCVDTGTALANGTSCGSNQVCDNGACTACTAGAACTPPNACDVGMTSCASGTQSCTDTGTAVTPGTSCGTNEVCSSIGVCTACTAGAACTPANACDVGTTVCSSGEPVCSDTGTAVANGTSCGSGGTCNNGSCMSCGGSINSQGNCSGTVCNQSYNGNVQVANGATCTLNAVTVTGNVTAGTGSTLAISGGSVSGNVQTNGSASLSLANAAVTGNVQPQNTGMVSVSGGSIHGNLQVQQSGTATASNVQVYGNVQIQSDTGATSVTGCAVGGNVQLQQNAGGTTLSGCTVTGNVSEQQDSGGSTVSNNASGGNIQLQQNTGGLSVTGNTWNGNLQCQGDSPPAAGQCSN